MRILHLMDDEKFIDIAISIFEEVNPDSNIYLVGIQNINSSLKFIKSDKVLVRELRTNEYYDIACHEKYDLVIVHYLDYDKSSVINLLPQDLKIVWLMWGADFYSTCYYTGKLYQNRTAKIINKIKVKSYFKNVLLPSLKNAINTLVPRKVLFKQVYKKAISRISYCATVVPSEFELLKSLSFFEAKQVYFSYGTLDLMIPDMENRINVQANSILVGNSSTPESNHLDAFHKIANIDYEFDQVIVPLSYGNFEGYTEEVIREGKSFFSTRFSPLLGFMPIALYTDFLKNCRFAVFNHERQQAVGNIIMMLYLGTKVFLSENSPVFKYYKALGMVLYSFEKEFLRSNLVPLTDIETEKNRDLIRSIYGTNAVMTKTKETIANIEKDLL